MPERNQILLESNQILKKNSNKKLKMSSKEADDEPQTPEIELRRQCNLAYDNIISQIKNKYEAMMKISEDFSFLNGYELSTMTTE